MKLDFNLQTTQRHGLALTAQVQQAIKLLHMTNVEIKEFVESAFEDNPFVETVTENATDDQKYEEVSTSKTDKDSKSDEYFVDPVAQSKIATENQFETGEGFIPSSTVSKREPDYDIVSTIKE